MNHPKPKKSLGQNFLADQDVVWKIIEHSQLEKEDVVLEVGPGRGILTEALAAKCAKVIAVEKDPDLIPVLKKRFRGKENVEMIQGDILETDIAKIVPRSVFHASGYKLIANLPYYITSPILRKFLEIEVPPQEMILMVQKEVAERIVAKPGAMSILAVSVQYYANPEILFEVPRTAFDPVPEVDSAVIKIKNHESRIIDQKERDNFFRVVRAGFCARRKTLLNNLANSFHLPKDDVLAKLSGAGIPEGARAQELSIGEWKNISILF